jgi:hypothetical protein
MNDDMEDYKVVRSRVVEGKSLDTDLITPVEIKHQVEEIFAEGELTERYNHIVYEFEKDGVYCFANAYLDGIDVVSIFGPFSDREQRNTVESPEFYEQVLAYLKRRFFVITTLGEEGYVTVWQQPGYTHPE